MFMYLLPNMVSFINTDELRATAILATLSSPATYASLTGDYGWSFDQCEAWLQDLLRHQLLAPPGRRRARSGLTGTDGPRSPAS